MSSINFSNEQLSAIEKRNSSLLVSAAAGSGKTAVLVERIIRKITEEKVNINELLVVTFTNAAANGMKEKIKKAIKECIKKDKTNSFLKKQLYLTDSANISTVHAFCMNIIKKYSYLLPENVPVGFTLLTDTEQALIKQQVINELINEYYEKNDEVFEKLSESYSTAKSDEMLIELILYLYSFLISIPDYISWIDKRLDDLKSSEDFYSSDFAKSLYNHIIKILKDGVGKYDYAIEYIDGDELLMPYSEVFKAERTALNDALKKDNLYDVLKAVEALEFENLNKHRAKKGADTTIPKTARNSIRDYIKDIKADYTNSIICAELESGDNIDIIFKLFEIIKEFDVRFKSAKYEKGNLDFNDLEHLVIGLLSDNGKLKEEFYPLRDSFNEIMVDEYQDTNDVQEAIFGLLKKDNNLFTVGDIKQSIYRFRHANPNLFIKRIKAYAEKNEGEVVSLNANYRCHENIINTVNCIFSFIMTENISKIDYKESEMLVCKGDFSNLPEDKLETELKIALCDSESEETIESVESEMIASAIKKMTEDEDFIIEGRRVSYSDIVILVRSFNEKTLTFLNNLKAEGIPAVYEDKTAFFETAEIKNIIALLKVIDNPYDDISLIATLRNIFGYTENMLIDIRLLKERCSFYEAFSLSENKKDKEILDYIKELKNYSLKYELSFLLRKIYDDTFFIERQSAFINGYKRKENSDRLIEIAREYENTEFKGIASFISYVNKIISGKRKLPAPKLTENADAVKIMSIHKSKGLEFPVVILAGMHKPFNKMDLNKNVILNSKIGIGYNVVNLDKQYRYKSVYKKIIEEDEKNELINEELRVLYVALTRAKYKLIMTAGINMKDEWYLKYTSSLMNSAPELSYIDFLGINCYLDMVMPPLLRHRAFSEHCGNKWIKDYDFKLDFSLYESEKFGDEDEEETKRNFEITPLEPEKISEFEERVGFKYSNPFSKIPKKISVSDLKDVLGEDYTAKTGARTEIYVPDFRSESSITAAERGTLIHYVFEKIDLDKMRNAENKLSVILEFIDDNQYLKERLTLSDLKKAEAFFESTIGIKMLRAREVWREKDFLIRMNTYELYSGFEGFKDDEKVIVQGIIDCLFVDTKGDVYLIDYKYVNRSEQEIKKTYSYQIKLYKEAVSKIRKIPRESIKAYIWDVNKQTVIDFNEVKK